MERRSTFSFVFGLLLFSLILITANNTNAQVRYQVTGNVFLEDQLPNGTHDGVSIKLFNLPGMTLEDSTVSLSDGSYTINVSPGYYLVRWEKAGYVPEELGGLALANDTTLSNVTLTPGTVMEVSGNVSGTWTTNYVYFVTDDITVPAGYSLTINAGVKVRFADSTKFTAYGTLNVSGTEEDPVVFTSLSPTPAPGDWDGLELYAVENNIKYLNYNWAANGIKGDGASNSVFEHVTIPGNLKLNSNGILLDHSSNVSIKYCDITASGWHAIYVSQPQTSQIIGNTLSGSFNEAAIWADNLNNGKIDSNIILGNPKKGIESNNSQNTEIEYNKIKASYYGMYIQNGSNYSVTGNEINVSSDEGHDLVGIHFLYSTSLTFLKNKLSIEMSHNGGSFYGFESADYGYAVGSAMFMYNNLSIKQINYTEGHYFYGYICNEANIDGDTLIIDAGNNYARADNSYAIYAKKLSLKNSYIYYKLNNNNNNNSDEYYYNVIRNYEGNEENIIENNYFEIVNTKHEKVINTKNATVKNNKIVFVNGSYNSYNFAIKAHGNSTIVNNVIENYGKGIYIEGSNNNVDSNNVFVSYEALSCDNAGVIAKHNLFKVNSGNAVYANNQSSLDLINNTIISSNAEYGFKSEGLSTVKVINNIFQGFNNGIYIDNSVTNYDIKNNNLWEISNNMFSGSAMPPLIGNFVAENNNGDPADIYGNISFEPLFTNPDSNDYTLQLGSHLINAGDPTYTDPDGTTADIGAYYHHIYVNIEHTPLTSTNDETGPYTVTAKIYSPSGLPVTAKLYYSINGGDYTSVDMTGNDSTFTADIPGQPLNTTINYYIEATDGEHTVTSPFNIENQIYTFHITLFSSFSNLSANSLSNGNIRISWNRPTPVSGTLIGFKLYKSETSDITLSDSLLITELPTDSLNFIDDEVNEGHTYYYLLSGLLVINSDTVESVVSEMASAISDDPTIVRVTGRIVLEGTNDYSGVKILFEKVSPSSIPDSVFTDSTGVLDKIMHVGIYNIHFTKDGYKPILLGEKFLSDNLDLDTVYMQQGGAVSISGEISGTLTNSNLYFIDGDVTVPVGDTLFIEPGTEIKFRGNYNFTVNGKLIAIGTPENRITFTSGMPAPKEGDWGRLILNNAPNSIIKYCNFYYGTNGIQIDNSDGTEISYNVFDNFKLDAKGIYSTNNNSSAKNYVIKNNNFVKKFSTGIYLSYFENSIINGNNMSVSDTGIYLTECKGNLDVSSNNISGSNMNIGIYVGFQEYANKKNIVVNSNTIDKAVLEGITINYADSTIINNNKINIYANSDECCRKSQGMLLNYIGYVFSRNNNLNEEYLDNGNSYGIYFTPRNNNSKFIFRKNRINNFNIGLSSNNTENSGIIIDSSYIKTIDYNEWHREVIVDNIRNVTLSNDTLYVGTNYCCDGINKSLFNNIYNSNIENCISNGGNYLFENCSNVIMKNSKFVNLTSYVFFNFEGNKNRDITLINNNIEFSEYHDSYITENVKFFGNRLKNHSLKIKGNSLINGNVFDNSSLVLTEGTNAKVFKNTFINGSDTAIVADYNATPEINSNLIYGYGTGIDAQSTVNSIKFNLIYNCNTSLTGDGLPSQAGEIVTVNNNGTPSDIYSNIFVDPLLAQDSTGAITYELLSGSPAINAGDIDSLDVDGTIADIGAYFYNFGYLPQNVRQDSTGDGFIAFSWDIVQTDSLQGYEPSYKLATDANWTTLDNITDKHITISGLTNNSVYSFRVRAVYPNGNSHYSDVVNGRPGTAAMSVSPKYLTAFLTNGNAAKTFYVSNAGNRDMTFNVLNHGSNSLNYNSAIVPPDSSFEVIDTLKNDADGVHVGKIIIASDDSESKIDTINVLRAVNIPDNLPAQHFTAVNPTDNKFYFVITNGMIDGDIQTGDEVALFDGETCVGAAGFNGIFPFIITAYGGGSGNGFTDGDTITVNIWDYGTSAVGKAVANYTVGNGTFQTGAFAEASFTGTIYQLFSIPIAPNRFNLISSYLLPRNTDASNIFGSIPGLEIAYEDNGSAYIPRYGINTIGNYDMTEGYHVFTTDSNATLVITGKKINVQNYSLTIQASRFNSIPYLYSKSMYDSAAFASIVNNIDIVQDDAGGVWIPSMNVNTLGNLQPAKGYQIYVNSSSDIYFTYPANSKNRNIKKHKNIELAKPEHFMFNETGISYTIVVNSASYDGRKLTNGDEIAVYDNGICVGAAVWDTSRTNYISAWKGDENLGVQGFRNGDEITIKMFIKEFNKEITGSPAFAKSGGQYFGKQPYSVTNITSDAGLIPKKFELSQNYPNPFNPSTIITYALPRKAMVKLIIYNVLGEVVKTLVNGETESAGNYKLQWNGDDNYGYKVSSGVYLIRLTAGNFVSVKKAVLLK